MAWRPFLLLHLAAFGLFGSWFLPGLSSFWQYLDISLFEALNGSLEGRPLTQIFWALGNVKISDLFGAIFMLTFSLIYAFDSGREKARMRLAEFIYVLIWFELGILALKEVLYPNFIAEHFLRDSPTLVSKASVLLSEVAPWLKIKDSSHWCFPSDHAFIIFQWAGFITCFCGWRLGLLAYVSSIFFILPRLIAGAHWLTDSLLGSLPLSLIVIAWACYTPLMPLSLSYLERLSSKLLSLFSKPKEVALYAKK